MPNTFTETSSSSPFEFSYFFRSLQDYFAGMLKSPYEQRLFEYLIFMGARTIKQGHEKFWHSYDTLQKKTGISSNTARRIVKWFESEGFVRTETKYERGHYITYFTVQFAHIATRMADLFGGPESDHRPDQLARIAKRKRALQGIARAQIRLAIDKKKLFGK